MSIQKMNPRFTVMLILMIAVAAMRIPVASCETAWLNFTPIGAMGLFGGAYFTKKWKAFAFPLLTLFASDLFINIFIYEGKYGIMYNEWYWIYGIFILIGFMGKWLIRTVNVRNVLTAAVVVSLSHWLIADFIVWAGGGVDLRTMQPLSRDWQGLLQSYTQGLPYMRSFLTGTLVYSGILFGTFEWMKQRYTSLQLNIN
jgi:hypothetical protein